MGGCKKAHFANHKAATTYVKTEYCSLFPPFQTAFRDLQVGEAWRNVLGCTLSQIELIVFFTPLKRVFLKRFYSLTFRERRREGEREGKKH